jgi:hypothetical protein
MNIGMECQKLIAKRKNKPKEEESKPKSLAAKKKKTTDVLRANKEEFLKLIDEGATFSDLATTLGVFPTTANAAVRKVFCDTTVEKILQNALAKKALGRGAAKEAFSHNAKVRSTETLEGQDMNIRGMIKQGASVNVISTTLGLNRRNLGIYIKEKMPQELLAMVNANAAKCRARRRKK